MLAAIPPQYWFYGLCFLRVCHAVILITEQFINDGNLLAHPTVLKELNKQDSSFSCKMSTNKNEASGHQEATASKKSDGFE